MLMFKLSLLVAVIASLLTQVKRRRARQLLAEYDAGTRCIGCESTRVERSGDRLHCLACNQDTSLSAIASARLTKEEIDSMTAPNRRDHL